MKGRKKDLLILFAVILALAVFLGGSEIQSVEEYYLVHLDDVKEDSQTVTFAIDCADVFAHEKDLDPAVRPFLPEDGRVFPETTLVLRRGDTVFDLLKRVCRAKNIQMEFQGADTTAFGSVYVQGIGYLYEFSCGPSSGWTFLVNGRMPDRGCSEVRPEDGDVILWTYSCSLDRLGPVGTKQ